MSQVTFYRDSSDVFRCQVDVQGASINESRVRLVLEFDNGKTYMFKGKVKSDGMCEISVPKLKEEDGSGGNAVLEVIAENAFFEPWQGNFNLKSRKSVQVESVQVSTSQDKRVTVSNVGGTSKKPTLVETILEGYKPSKQLITELKDYEPTKKIKEWGRKEFGDKINTAKARYVMMVVEARYRRLKKRNR